ncbi:MAG: hypothetical protein JWQ35_2308 [Bacteriovoracaceae bacterium]|nr:hypothetical protein [Bacteriovoracaceae bacterium]
MKFKFVGIAASLGLVVVSSLSAQGDVTTGAGGVNAPAAPISFSPSVASGVHTDSTKILNASHSTTVGPFITPALSIDYKSPTFNLNLGYSVEISGARGFGTASRDFGDNTYYDNNPIVTLSGGLSKNWKMNVLLDTHFKFYNNNEAENHTEIFLNPDVEYAVNSNLSFAAGYAMHRVNNFDAILTGKSAADDKEGSTQRSAVLPTEAGQSKTNTLHAGVLTMKNDLGFGKLVTFVRAGKRIGNSANVSGKSYRLQSELGFQSPIKALTGVVRYRFNVEDQNTAELKYYNQGRVIGSYALNANWSVDVFHELTASQNTQPGVAAEFENESYVGATFKF